MNRFFLKNPVLIILIIALTITHNSTTLANCGLGPYDVAWISIYPEPLLEPSLVQGSNMTVEIQFFNNTFINHTRLFVCQLTPEFRWEENNTMIGGKTSIRCPGTEKFVGNYTINLDMGAEIGYQIQIIYDNFSSVILPDTDCFLDKEIVEPETGVFCFLAGEVESSVLNTRSSAIIPSFISVLALALILTKKKAKV